MNKQQIIGRIGRDAETKHVGVGGNNPVTRFSVATTKRWKSRDGEKMEKTQWFTVIIWGKRGEALEQYLTKGTLVYVAGETEARKYEDKDGAMREIWEVVLSPFTGEIELLGGGKRGDSAGDPGDRDEAPPSEESSGEDPNEEKDFPW